MEIRVARKAAACGVMVAALSASFAAQANLVTNGGFETGDFSGWTASVGIFDGVDTAAPQAGNYAAFFGNVGGVSTISQTLSTLAGKTYVIDFWLQAESDPLGNSAPNSFQFDWGGAPVASIVNSANFGYTEFQYWLTANSASTTISFSFSNTPAFWDFDSVSVNIPEPSSLALAIGALGILAALKRRSEKNAPTARLTA